jgi:hypothetical protein
MKDREFLSSKNTSDHCFEINHVSLKREDERFCCHVIILWCYVPVAVSLFFAMFVLLVFGIVVEQDGKSRPDDYCRSIIMTSAIILFCTT